MTSKEKFKTLMKSITNPVTQDIRKKLIIKASVEGITSKVLAGAIRLKEIDDDAHSADRAMEDAEQLKNFSREMNERSHAARIIHAQLVG